MYFKTTSGKAAMTPRLCTNVYKIQPMMQKLRKLAGAKTRRPPPPGTTVNQWFGISYDESTRMRDSRYAWLKHYYPLVDLKMTRDDCHAWLAEHELTAPRSACVGCPYHSAEEWARIKADPELWADAVEFDELIRTEWTRRFRRPHNPRYLHRSRVPLVDLVIDDGENSWEQECEGVCGV